MTLALCPVNVWTTVPDLAAATIISATERGLCVDTSGVLTPDQRYKGFLLAGGQSMVIAAGTPIRVAPANDLKATTVRYTAA